MEEMHSSSLVAHPACPPESKSLKKVVLCRGVKKAKRARHSYPRQIGLILTLSDKNFSSQGAVFYSSSLSLAAKHEKWKGRGCDGAPIGHQSAIAGERRGKKSYISPHLLEPSN